MGMPHFVELFPSNGNSAGRILFRLKTCPEVCFAQVNPGLDDKANSMFYKGFENGLNLFR
jgi:hypothetical protein